VTVLGAGAVGSALATPFREAGWEVNLWGKWLDDHLLDACRHDQPHPRTGVRLAKGTCLFDSGHLLDALADAELVAVAIASVGVLEVVRRALAGLGEARALLLASKGFSPDEEGRVRLFPDAGAQPGLRAPAQAAADRGDRRVQGQRGGSQAPDGSDLRVQGPIDCRGGGQRGDHPRLPGGDD
jgi:NAD-dependent glycerol-3-phosphate dehydrogenase N-terminus